MISTSISPFSSYQLGSVELKNRIVMAPMTRSRAGDGGRPTELMVEYYAQRAAAGLIITEGTQPSVVGQGYPDTPGLHTAEQVTAWRVVTEALMTCRPFGASWYEDNAPGPASDTINTPR